MFKKFFTLLSTITTITAVTFCFSDTPALASRVKVARNCVAFNPDTGFQVRTTPRIGMYFNVVKYYRAINGTPMPKLVVWDPYEYRRGTIAIPMRCLQLNSQGVIEYPPNFKNLSY